MYLVARFDLPPPPGPADPFHVAVDYIGRTKTAPLRARWHQFLRAAGGNFGHAGGNSFHAAYVTVENSASLLAKTYVAGLPIWVDNGAQPATSFRTAMVEATLVDAVHHHRARENWAALLNKA